MEARQGIFIAIEGTDGSGKGTQFAKLVERLTAEGHDVATFDFPQYDQPSSYFVQQYLNGKYGTVEEVGPYTGSLFFSLDRYEAASKIRQALSEGKVVITNRFTGSNMAHQGTKFAGAEERRGYFIWLDNLEFQMLRIPRPDYNFVLRVPADIAQQLVDKKDARSYTDKKRDIHEADLSHLTKSVQVYDDLCQLFPRDYIRLDCVRGDRLLSIDEVHKLLWEKIVPKLPAPHKKQRQAATVIERDAVTASPDRYLQRKDGRTSITKAGKEFLDEAVTSSTGNVYAFTDKVSPVLVADALSRMNGTPGDLRLNLLTMLEDTTQKDKNRSSNTLQELSGLHFVLGKVTQLATESMEWGIGDAWVEPPISEAKLDKRDEHGNFRYYVPPALDATTKNTYCEILDDIFAIYTTLLSELTVYLTHHSDTPKNKRGKAWKRAIRVQADGVARLVLPLSTTTTIGAYASLASTKELIARLLANELSEVQSIGADLLRHAQTATPLAFTLQAAPTRTGSPLEYETASRESVQKYAADTLPAHYSDNNQAVTLTSFWPHKELDLVADMLYGHSDLPLAAIQEAVDVVSYEQKLAVFEAYIGDRQSVEDVPGKALCSAQYKWDLLCSFDTLSELRQMRTGMSITRQPLTPRYGFNVPQLVQDAGLTDEFETCFELSLKLYSVLQSAGFRLEAQYATLRGHEVRSTAAYDAQSAFCIHESGTITGSAETRSLVRKMHEILAHKHPLIAEAMKFVDQD
jgi:dTMP kinase